MMRNPRPESDAVIAIVNDAPSVRKSLQGQFSVNGQRPDANYFTVDGVSANFGVTGYAALVQAAGGALPALSASGGTMGTLGVAPGTN
jgi:hypothetical protein